MEITLSHETLILNSDGSANQIFPWERGIVCDLFKYDRYHVLAYYNRVIRDGSSNEYQLPAVLMFKKYVPYKEKVAAYSKKNIFARDKYTCQYCGKEFPYKKLEVDHVIPRSRWEKLGGSGKSANVFENVVTSCKPCNSKKGDKLCHECNMFPLNKPRKITRREALFLRLQHENIPKEWRPYLESIIHAEKNAQEASRT